MNTVSISVIVPVYNVEETLERCLESILSQNFKDYEIILVNDGSTDNSGSICDQYAKKHQFIRVIHKENEGLGPTRNAGVKLAKGKYVYHCDSDDWLSPNLLQDCYTAAESNDANIVVFGYTIYTEENELKQYQTIKAPQGFYETKTEAREFFIEQFSNSFVVQSACNRLIKRDFLINNDIWFKPFRRCQDVIFSLDLFGKASRVFCIDKSYYNYIITPGIYKGRSYDEMLSIYIDVYEYIKKSLQEWDIWNKENQDAISSLYTAHIANYVSFYAIHKSKHPFKDIKTFLGNKKVRSLFSASQSASLSKFLTLTNTGIKLKSTFILFIVFWLHERRKG